jgi:hypothetical protein
MAEEPGFTIKVIGATGSVVDLVTTADAARHNIAESAKNPRSSLMGKGDPSNRAELHFALSLVATDVLLAGDQQIRQMQDANGSWWSFRRSEIGGVAVIDHTAFADDTPRATIGFVFTPE